MFNIIRADMYRIIRGKGLYLCFAVIILTLCVSIYLKQAGHIGINTEIPDSLEISEDMTIDDVFGALMNVEEHEVDVDIMASGGNLYYFFIFAVFTIFCTDVSNHTVKNVISSGITRRTYYVSKLLLSLGIGTIFILFHTYGGYLGNIIYNGSAYSSSLGDVTKIMVSQLPVFYGMIGILVMLCVVTQKTSKYTAITLILVMGTQLVVTIASAIFQFDTSLVLQYEFEGILRSVAVLGDIPMKTLITGVGIGSTALVASTIIGLEYFKKCTIK